MSGDGHGSTLLIIGPSGVGKSTLVRALAATGEITATPSWTTRPRRSDEGHSTTEHVFVSDAEFDALQADGFFVDAAAPFGLPYRYGFPRPLTADAGSVSCLMTRAALVALITGHLAGTSVIYQVEAPYDRASSYIEGRHDGTDLGLRLSQWEAERDLGRSLAQRCFMNDSTIDVLLSDVRQAIADDFRFSPAHAGPA